MATPTGSSGIAWNPATASENRIHSDEVARRYGFRGGLVPGVTAYACMVDPALRAWGLDWLRGGGADVVLRRPLYAGERFRVETEVDEGGERDEKGGERFHASLHGPDGICAEGTVFARRGGELPRRRGDPPAPLPDDRPDATREALESLREEGEKGLGAIAWRWDGRGENARYRESLDDIPDLVRPDREGWAHPGFTLGLANWVLSRNVRLGPWVHVESRVRHHAPLALGAETVTEARVTDLFERRGHEFVDLDVAVYGDGDAPILSAFHRAIYQLRDPA